MTPYNKRRTVGYTLLLIMCVVLLTGCALFPSRFDPNEHARIVNIHVLSQDNSVCTNRDLAAAASHIMYQDARWAWHYGQHLPNNQKMTEMTKNLMEMTKELHDRYQKTEPVSAFYCRSKLENIHRATDRIVPTSARRPR